MRIVSVPALAPAAEPRRLARAAADAAPARAVAGLPPRQLLALLALYGCWGSSLPVMAIMVRTIPPLAGAGAVFLAGGVLLLAAARARRPAPVASVRAGATRAPRPEPGATRRAATAGILLLVGGQGGATVALTQLTASLTSIVAATIPLVVAVMGMLLGRRLPRAALAWLVVGFAGVALATLTAPAAALGGSATGLLVLGGAVLSWAAGTVYGARAALPQDVRVSSGVQLVTGGVVLLALAAACGQLAPSAWADVDAGSLAAAGFLLLFDSVLGYWLYAHLLRTAPTELVSTYSYVTPLLGALIGFTVLAEPFWGGAALGAAIVALGVIGQVRAQAG